MSDFLDQVRNDHHQFDKGRLEDHVGSNPFDLFSSWLKEAVEKEAREANAMAVSTIGVDGNPRSRIVYLREIWQEGFVFYTNYNSDKGKALAANPNAHILFFWPELQRQVSITGKAEQVPAEMSDRYFASRPRTSQLGAWASHQSEELADRKELENRINELEQRFPEVVPRPPHWGGYVLFPESIEFWQGRPSRLHDRICFEKTAEAWKLYRKNP